MDLIPETYVTNSPDITSIISCFEANRNPLELFAPTINQHLSHRLHALDQQIDDLIDNLKKFHSFAKSQDYAKVLTRMQQKLNVNFEKTCISNCSRCDLTFNLNDPDDLAALFNHEHAVEQLCKKARNNFDLSIQQISKKNNHYRCLVCRVLITGAYSVRSHVRGKPHLKKSNNVGINLRIREYFKAFETLPQDYRVFDVIFEPSDLEHSSDIIFCTVCGTYVSVAVVPQHVKDKTHVIQFKQTDYTYLNGYTDMLNISGCGVGSEVMLTSPKVKTEKPRKKPKKIHSIGLAYNLNTRDVKSFDDIIPNRYKSHVKYLSGDVNEPVCTLCTMILKGFDYVLEHFVSDEHRTKYRLDSNVENNNSYSFYCCLCCKHFKKEFKWMAHVISVAHQQKESLIPKQGTQTNFAEYECTSCLMVWFGPPNSVYAHKKNKLGVGDARAKQKEVTLSSEMVRLLKDEAAFAADISKAVRESSDVLNSIESAHKCCRAIEAALAPTFGDQIQAYPFGSRVSGLGNIASDLDVFVDIGSMYEGTINQNPQFQSYCVQQTAAALRRHKDFTDICPIPQARTPIVQVFHKNTDLDCDLSFRHGLSIENTQFLKFCINIQPKLRSLILFLKKWIRLNKFRDRISTYGISLMSIYMMQNKGYLPSLAKLRQIDPQQSKIIAGWETFRFEKPLSEIQFYFPPYQNSERHLLTEFFDFYINFDYQMEVVCPLLGEPVDKILFGYAEASDEALPEEMMSYVNKIKDNENHERFKMTKSICIQDPFDLSHNVTKALPCDIYIKMITLMKKSIKLLQ